MEINETFKNETLRNTMALNDTILREIWNTYAEESAHGSYYLYDIRNEKDVDDLCQMFGQEKIALLVIDMVLSNRKYVKIDGVRNDKFLIIQPRDLIKAYWNDILTRIINFPFAYEEIAIESHHDSFYLYEKIILPSLCKQMRVTNLRK